MRQLLITDYRLLSFRRNALGVLITSLSASSVYRLGAGCILLCLFMFPAQLFCGESNPIPKDRVFNWDPGVRSGISSLASPSQPIKLKETDQDPAAVIQKAINITKTPGVVLLPAGTFKIKKQLKLKSEDNNKEIPELPPSLYLKEKPEFWGDLPWPAIGADVDQGENLTPIPAELRYRSNHAE